MNSQIVLVDDDRNILVSVSMALEAAGFTVRGFSDGSAALKNILDTPADLLITDIKMPEMDGFTLLKKLRDMSAVPVIFLTSKDDEADEVMGFQLGADDYIKKPFSQKLLIERIKALLRREQIKKHHAPQSAPAAARYGDLVMDEQRHMCAWKSHDVGLTVTEFLVLKGLLNPIGHLKSRDQLVHAAYGEQAESDDRMIDSHIKRLRRKFKEIDPDFDAIETLYGAGYRYKEPK